MVMEVSRAEYLANEKLKRQLAHKESSTSGAEPSSSGASEYIFVNYAVSQLVDASDDN